MPYMSPEEFGQFEAGGSPASEPTATATKPVPAAPQGSNDDLGMLLAHFLYPRKPDGSPEHLGIGPTIASLLPVAGTIGGAALGTFGGPLGIAAGSVAGAGIGSGVSNFYKQFSDTGGDLSKANWGDAAARTGIDTAASVVFPLGSKVLGGLGPIGRSMAENAAFSGLHSGLTTQYETGDTGKAVGSAVGGAAIGAGLGPVAHLAGAGLQKVIPRAQRGADPATEQLLKETSVGAPIGLNAFKSQAKALAGAAGAPAQAPIEVPKTLNDFTPEQLAAALADARRFAELENDLTRAGLEGLPVRAKTLDAYLPKEVAAAAQSAPQTTVYDHIQTVTPSSVGHVVNGERPYAGLDLETASKILQERGSRPEPQPQGYGGIAAHAQDAAEFPMPTSGGYVSDMIPRGIAPNNWMPPELVAKLSQSPSANVFGVAPELSPQAIDKMISGMLSGHTDMRPRIEGNGGVPEFPMLDARDALKRRAAELQQAQAMQEAMQYQPEPYAVPNTGSLTSSLNRSEAAGSVADPSRMGLGLSYSAPEPGVLEPMTSKNTNGDLFMDYPTTNDPRSVAARIVKRAPQQQQLPLGQEPEQQFQLNQEQVQLDPSFQAPSRGILPPRPPGPRFNLGTDYEPQYGGQPPAAYGQGWSAPAPQNSASRSTTSVGQPRIVATDGPSYTTEELLRQLAEVYPGIDPLTIFSRWTGY